MPEKHSINISGHQTSFSLEPEFWAELKNIAKAKNQSISAIIKGIDDQRTTNLSSALRVYILKHYITNQEQPSQD